MNQWLNRGHPQTLQNATILAYLEAGFGLLLGLSASTATTRLVIVAGLAAGGFGIANDKRWGYYVAIGAAALRVASFFYFYRLDWLTNVYFILDVAFAVALLALLVHPQSREYQKIWFR